MQDQISDMFQKSPLLNYLAETLNLTQSTQEKLAVCLINVNHFQDIQHLLGLTPSQQWLKFISERIQGQLRQTDFFCRYSDHTFALVLEKIDTFDETVDIIERILQQVHMAIEIKPFTIYPSINIGIATYPKSGLDTSELIQNAFFALQESQNERENTYHFFQEDAETVKARRRDIAQALSTAIANQEFNVLYQPQLSLKTGTLVGFEALIRWEHPLLGKISPDEFIPLAEELGSIDLIGEWVLEKIALDFFLLKGNGNNCPFIAFNISVKQLEHHKFLNFVKTTLQKYQIPADKIIFEITETAIVKHPEHVKKMLLAFKNIGIHSMLDDFGAGYSSLSYLKKLPISYIKLDKSFIKNLLQHKADEAIVLTMINLAHHLNLAVVAEGVNSQALLDYLKKHHCDMAQGFYIAEPMSIEESVEFIAKKISNE